MVGNPGRNQLFSALILSLRLHATNCHRREHKPASVGLTFISARAGYAQCANLLSLLILTNMWSRGDERRGATQLCASTQVRNGYIHVLCRLNQRDPAAVSISETVKLRARQRLAYRTQASQSLLILRAGSATPSAGIFMSASRATVRPFRRCSSMISSTSDGSTCAYHTPSG
jgi:hypothetical protein